MCKLFLVGSERSRPLGIIYYVGERLGMTMSRGEGWEMGQEMLEAGSV